MQKTIKLKILLLLLPILILALIFVYNKFLDKRIYIENSNLYIGKFSIENENSIKKIIDIKMYNFGISDIYIKNISASCGCLKIDCAKLIPAMSSITLSAHLEMMKSDFSGKEILTFFKNASA